MEACSAVGCNQPNLTTLLNCSCVSAWTAAALSARAGREPPKPGIMSAFADCSGDSVLGRFPGAARSRELDEFG